MQDPIVQLIVGGTLGPISWWFPVIRPRCESCTLTPPPAEGTGKLTCQQCDVPAVVSLSSQED